MIQSENHWLVVGGPGGIGMGGKVAPLSWNLLVRRPPEKAGACSGFCPDMGGDLQVELW